MFAGRGSHAIRMRRSGILAAQHAGASLGVSGLACRDGSRRPSRLPSTPR